MRVKIKKRLTKKCIISKPTETLKEFSEALDTIKDQVDEVLDPILVIQAENDNMIDPQSTNYIYEHVDSDEKGYQMV